MAHSVAEAAKALGDRLCDYPIIGLLLRAGFVITFWLMGVIYMLIPFERLKLSTVLPGLLVTTCAIELGKGLFSFYYENISSHDLVYGSVSSIIVLLLWLYFCARALLYGSEVICVYRQSLASSVGAD